LNAIILFSTATADFPSNAIPVVPIEGYGIVIDRGTHGQQIPALNARSLVENDDVVFNFRRMAHADDAAFPHARYAAANDGVFRCPGRYADGRVAEFKPVNGRIAAKGRAQPFPFPSIIALNCVRALSVTFAFIWTLRRIFRPPPQSCRPLCQKHCLGNGLGACRGHLDGRRMSGRQPKSGDRNDHEGFSGLKRFSRRPPPYPSCGLSQYTLRGHGLL